MSTLFASDLDGTLLNSDSRLSPETERMLNRAIDAGALFTVATARTPATVAELMKGVALQLPLVVMTGAALWDPRTGRYLDTRFHKEEDVRALLRIYRRHSLPTFIYTLRDDQRLHIYHIGPLSDHERRFIAERSGMDAKVFHIPESGESILPDSLGNVVLLFAMQPASEAEKAYDDIRRIEGVNSVFYHDIFDPSLAFIEAFPAEATKAKALARLAAMTGADRMVVFGDNMNDIPMLRAASEGVAVENAVPEVKAVADTVIGRNTEDAVAREILRRTLKT